MIRGDKNTIGMEHRSYSFNGGVMSFVRDDLTSPKVDMGARPYPI